VYAGDEFIDGFLANCEALEGYEDCQHLLMRPASPGQESQQLLSHVRRFPNTVYLNLEQDPGLYEVWNLGARLATGRYLSNANIDDRRAPGQLKYLEAVLTEYPQVDVASTALRVSRQKNLAWEHAGDCPVMLDGGRDRVYSSAELFQYSTDGLVARNLPHCMPLWRRTLYARIGAFDEARYGPSADWALWLRAGRSGALFHFSTQPMGLYLNDVDSYWRRSEAGRQADARIVFEFAGDSGRSPTPVGVNERLLRPLFATAIQLFQAGAILEGMGQLLLAAQALPQGNSAAMALSHSLAQSHLGFTDAQEWAGGVGPLAGPAFIADTSLFNALVDLIHRFDPSCLGEQCARIHRNLLLACIDWQECSGATESLLLQALLARVSGDFGREATLLRRSFLNDRAAFWRAVQDVYRFSRPLSDLANAVSAF
jgi:hypothetical protein